MSILLLSALPLFAFSFWYLRHRTLSSGRERLWELAFAEASAGAAPAAPDDWTPYGSILPGLRDRLGKAGLLDGDERRRFKQLAGAAVAGMAALFALIGLRWGAPTAAACGLSGAYLGVMLVLFYLGRRRTEFQREITFQLPLVLESIILLVESGMGVLPALEASISMREQLGRRDPLTRILRLVYQLAAHGLPFRSALEEVAGAVESTPLRHALLHLDVSSAEGGELVPSLKSLSDYTYTDWRLSVETRVKRLENLVVFPVFVSVVGLMILTASVPIVPVAHFFNTLKSNQAGIGGVGSGKSGTGLVSQPLSGSPSTAPDSNRQAFKKEAYALPK